MDDVGNGGDGACRREVASDVDHEGPPGVGLVENEALSSNDVARIFPGVTAAQARRAIRRRAASGDPAPLKIKGAWLAPLFWWRTVIADEVGKGPREGA